MGPRYLLKNPVLAIGMLVFIIFLFDLSRRGFLQSRRDKLVPSSCRASLVMLDKRIPASWSTACADNAMTVTAPFRPNNELKEKLQGKQTWRAAMYRELANQLVFVAKNSPMDSFERMAALTFKLTSPRLTIVAFAKGEDAGKLRTLTDDQFIRQHIQETILVQENWQGDSND